MLNWKMLYIAAVRRYAFLENAVVCVARSSLITLMPYIISPRRLYRSAFRGPALVRTRIGMARAWPMQN
jgi:hypothetical protein